VLINTRCVRLPQGSAAYCIQEQPVCRRSHRGTLLKQAPRTLLINYYTPGMLITGAASAFRRVSGREEKDIQFLITRTPGVARSRLENGCANRAKSLPANSTIIHSHDFSRAVWVIDPCFCWIEVLEMATRKLRAINPCNKCRKRKRGDIYYALECKALSRAKLEQEICNVQR